MTFYLSGSVPPAARPLLDSGAIGFMSSPNIGNVIQPGWTWAADNGCFSGAFDELRWFTWLADRAHLASTCLFAVAPDVPFGHAATKKRSAPWLARIRALGFPVAWCAQNGATVDDVPWDDFDVLFIAGDTAFKVGPEAQSLAYYAKGVGKRVHMGRVNPVPTSASSTRRRWRATRPTARSSRSALTRTSHGSRRGSNASTPSPTYQ